MLGIKIVTQATWDKLNHFKDRCILYEQDIHSLHTGEKPIMNIDIINNYINKLQKVKKTKLTKIVMSPDYMRLFMTHNLDIITYGKKYANGKTRFYVQNLELVEDTNIMGWYVK